MITVATDRMCRELRDQLADDHSDLDTSALFEKRDRTASHYMLYAVKPLSGGADRGPDAEAIRALRRDLLAELWLHLDGLCSAR